MVSASPRVTSLTPIASNHQSLPYNSTSRRHRAQRCRPHPRPLIISPPLARKKVGNAARDKRILALAIKGLTCQRIGKSLQIADETGTRGLGIGVRREKNGAGGNRTPVSEQSAWRLYACVWHFVLVRRDCCQRHSLKTYLRCLSRVTPEGLGSPPSPNLRSHPYRAWGANEQPN